MRFILGLIAALVLVAGGVFVAAGRMAGPSVEISQPAKFIGASSPLEVRVSAPGANLKSLRIALEQNGKQHELFTLGDPKGATVKQDGADRLLVTGAVGKEKISELTSGTARVLVTASRPVVYGIRNVETQSSKDVQVRLERPRLAIVSTHHYINHGGSETVVYRVTPADVTSGVLVGDIEYPGYPATGVTVEGVRISDPDLRVAFFALLHDQDLKTPIRLFARDEAGNSARADFDHRTFPKPFKRSRIQLDDRFLDRVVPAILESTTEIKPEGDTVAKFLTINGDLRRKNAEKIRGFGAQTTGELLWRGIVFHPFTNSAVESAFADHRTYIYKGREIDQQIHLGFDLASYTGTPVVAANRGKVLYADELGIYGNCVILDHGMGVQSLYAHLSSMDVKSGQIVDKEATLGRSGMTGLAGGDHLHFTMLVNGQMVNPVEWWDAHWIEDRILRKLRAIGGSSPTRP
jgi:murein DD-endopeptidase MepM/ murein hydrolase activator NlpD